MIRSSKFAKDRSIKIAIHRREKYLVLSTHKMMYMILLLSCLLSVASAFTPGVGPSTKHRQTETPLDNAFCYYEDCVPPSILHPLNEMGVDLDDDDMDIISRKGWVDYAINRSQMSTVKQRPKTTSKPNEGLEEILISFSPVALLILLEIIMAEVHSNGGTVFAQTMFH